LTQDLIPGVIQKKHSGGRITPFRFYQEVGNPLTFGGRGTINETWGGATYAHSKLGKLAIIWI